jgi:hypothetical protein
LGGGGGRYFPSYFRPKPAVEPKPRLAEYLDEVYDVTGQSSSSNAPQSAYGVGTVEILPVTGQASGETRASEAIAFAQIDNRIPTNRKRGAILATLLSTLTKR